MELSPENLVVVGLVASVVIQGLRLLSNRFGYDAPREVVTVVLFAVSVGLAVGFFGLPAVGGSDPSDFAGSLIKAATAVFGSAALIYNVLLNKVLRPVE